MSYRVFLHLSPAERDQVRRLEAQSRHLAQRNRCRAVLLSDKGHTVGQIALLLDIDPSTVRGALRRFRRGGPPGLQERPRSGRPSLVPP